MFKYCLSICRLFSENNTPIRRLALHLVKIPLSHTPILNGVWDPAIFCIICYLIAINFSSYSFKLFKLFINLCIALNSLAWITSIIFSCNKAAKSLWQVAQLTSCSAPALSQPFNIHPAALIQVAFPHREAPCKHLHSTSALEFEKQRIGFLFIYLIFFSATGFCTYYTINIKETSV